MCRIVTGMQVTATFLGTSLVFFWPFLFGFMEWDVESVPGAPSLSEEPVAMLDARIVWRAEEIEAEFQEKGDSEPGLPEVKPKPQENGERPSVAGSTAPSSQGSQARPRPAKGGGVAGASKKGGSRGEGRGRRKCSDDNPQIQKQNQDSWTVERRLVDWYSLRWKEIGGLGYAAPHELDGGVRGMRIVGIRCNNDLNQVGLRNGDVVIEVNGRPVRSLGQAVWLYQTVNKRKEIVVTVIRRGERRNLRYELT
jgi:hypothetical protein